MDIYYLVSLSDNHYILQADDFVSCCLIMCIWYCNRASVRGLQWIHRRRWPHP